MGRFDKMSKEALKELEAMTRNRYEEERDREESLISQATNMQTVFAVSTAALFMLLPVLIENRGKLSLMFFFVSMSVITTLLIISLTLATIAQWRFVVLNMPSAANVVEGFKNNIRDIVDDDRILTIHNIQLYVSVQNSRNKCNNKRVLYIRMSMVVFFLSVLSCFLFYIAGVVSLFFL